MKINCIHISSERFNVRQYDAQTNRCSALQQHDFEPTSTASFHLSARGKITKVFSCWWSVLSENKSFIIEMSSYWVKVIIFEFYKKFSKNNVLVLQITYAPLAVLCKNKPEIILNPSVSKKSSYFHPNVDVNVLNQSHLIQIN